MEACPKCSTTLTAGSALKDFIVPTFPPDILDQTAIRLSCLADREGSLPSFQSPLSDKLGRHQLQTLLHPHWWHSLMLYSPVLLPHLYHKASSSKRHRAATPTTIPEALKLGS